MAKKLPSSEYVGLRKCCIELLEAGHIAERVSEMLGCSPSWVSKTKVRYKTEGEVGLLSKKPGGNKARLSEGQIKELLEALKRGAEAHGFSGQIWTRKRVGAVIFKMFGQDYEVSQIGRILKKAGWTKQKPQVKARQQNAEAVKNWRENTLVALKKKPKKKTG
jgi:transposase